MQVISSIGRYESTAKGGLTASQRRNSVLQTAGSSSVEGLGLREAVQVLHGMMPKADFGGQLTIGALIIRTRFWGPLYYNYNKGPPKQYRQLLKPLYYGGAAGQDNTRRHELEKGG